MRPVLLLKRLAVVFVTSVLALALLTAAVGAIALNADWSVPDRRTLDAPSVMTDRTGSVIARFTSALDRQPVTLDQVSPEAADAVVASEDVRFYEHTGVDVISLVRAVYRNVRTGGIEQGGSTLTQQLVKNGLEGVGRERTIVRKVREAVVSLALEKRLRREEGSTEAAKDRILEDYLNTVFFGEGAYGIQAAAQEFFGVDAIDLTAAQGALLAQALPAPTARNPRADPDGSRERRDRVLRTMLDNDLLDQDAYTAAIDEAADVLPRRSTAFAHPYFTEYARKQVVAQYGEDALLTGGLTIRTSLDVEVQRALEEAVAEVLPPQDGVNADVDAGAVALDPRTGDVLGIYGGRDFATQQQDLATQGRRQNGSTFKPFGFIAALEAGRSPTATVGTPTRQTIQPADCTGAGTEPLLGEPWGPVFGPGGSMPLRDALMRSVNPAFQRLACDLGPDRILDVAQRLGVANVIDPVPSVGLGGAAFGASVLDMASAFGTLANDGRLCPARSILSVRDRAGVTLDAFTEVTVVPGMETRRRLPPGDVLAGRPRDLRDLDGDRCVQSVEPDVARTTTSVLQDVVAFTTGRRADIDRPQAGKTGTTDNETDAWFVGYTPDVVIAVWVGHRDCGDSSNPDCALRNIGGFSRVQGGTIPALIWKAAAERILEDVPAHDFPEVGERLRGDRAPAPERARPTPSDDPSASESDQPGDDDPDGDPDESEPTPDPSESEPCILVIGNCG